MARPGVPVRRHSTSRGSSLGGGHGAVHADQRELAGRLHARVREVTSPAAARPRRRSAARARRRPSARTSPAAIASSRQPPRTARRAPRARRRARRRRAGPACRHARRAARRRAGRLPARSSQSSSKSRRSAGGDVDHAVVGGDEQRGARRQCSASRWTKPRRRTSAGPPRGGADSRSGVPCRPARRSTCRRGTRPVPAFGRDVIRDSSPTTRPRVAAAAERDCGEGVAVEAARPDPACATPAAAARWKTVGVRLPACGSVHGAAARAGS